MLLPVFEKHPDGVDIGVSESAKLSAMTPFRYVDLFAGIGGFHAMLNHAGGRGVYVSEIDSAALGTYEHNWVDPLPDHDRPQINTDIALATPEFDAVDVPEHSVLAAGFPCQPFSKSGFQRGMDETRGTLFWNIARILETRRPAVVLLENVRNLAGPRHRHEWDVIITTLRELGYRVSSTPTVFSPHFLPPSLGGTPQVRERVFILGTYVGRARAMSETVVAPTVVRGPVDGWTAQDWDVNWILDDDSEIHGLERYTLNPAETRWIEVWDNLNQAIRAATGTRLPGFPLWADYWEPERSLEDLGIDDLPRWKADFIRKNAQFYEDHKDIIDAWRREHRDFADFPPSRRKLEWQAQDHESLWDTVMHFRPSGIRAKAPNYLPALVAITQTSIIGSRQRRITPREAARLQGLPRGFQFANTREAQSYKQVGNGVAVGAAWHVFRTHVERDQADLPQHLVDAVLSADLNPSPDALSPAAFKAEIGLQARRPETTPRRRAG